ncbi:MAG: hypothetical protein ABI423_07860 [Burkholderiales bacterium]
MAASHLIFDGVMQRYAKLKIVLPQSECNRACLCPKCAAGTQRK